MSVPSAGTPSSALQLVDAQEAFIEIKGHKVSLKFTIVKFFQVGVGDIPQTLDVGARAVGGSKFTFL